MDYTILHTHVRTEWIKQIIFQSSLSGLAGERNKTAGTGGSGSNKSTAELEAQSDALISQIGSFVEANNRII